MSGPLSLSGAQIDGESLVRFVYVDESGISANESILVAAGVIIHADSQWKLVENCIRQLTDRFVAEEDRSGFIFHATELFHGSGKVFGNREKYPLERSREALKRLLNIPSMFQLPVVVGFTRKQKLPTDATREERREALALDHAIAFSLCAVGAEKFMRTNAHPTEVATMTAEDNTQTKKTIKLMHDALRGVHPHLEDWMKQRALVMNLGHDFFPLRKVVDTIHFVEKSGAFLLQIADACASIVRFYLEEKANIEEFLREFMPRGPQAIADIEKVRSHYAGMIEVRCWDWVART